MLALNATRPAYLKNRQAILRHQRSYCSPATATRYVLILEEMMKILVFTSVAIVLLAELALSTEAGAQRASKPQVRESMIVSNQWLSKHMKDDSLVLLQVGEKDEYLAAHIPGAQLITTADISTPRGEGLSLELPPVAQLKTTLEKLGVSDKSRIVLYYSKDWVSLTARVYLTLDYLGLGDRTSILDGGLPAWRGEGRPVTSVVDARRPGKLNPKLKKQLVVDAAWVSENLSKPGVAILDARAPQFYTGAEAGRMPRAGHIPNAKSIPFSSLLEDSNNKFKSAAALRELFDKAGLKTGDTVATYCHIGQQASLLYFAARYLGYDAHLYDGSFEEWSRRQELPVNKSGATKKDVKP